MFLPKYEPKIVRISALQCGTVQGRNPYNIWFIFWEKRCLHKFTDLLKDSLLNFAPNQLLQLMSVYSLLHIKDNRLGTFGLDCVRRLSNKGLSVNNFRLDGPLEIYNSVLNTQQCLAFFIYLITEHMAIEHPFNAELHKVG